MDGQWFQIDDRMINPAHIVDIDLNAQVPGFGGYDKTESAVKITLSATEGEFDTVGSLSPRVLTYFGSQADVLRPFLSKLFPCQMRSIQLPEPSKVGDGESQVSQANYVCQLNTCNVSVSRKGYFCSDECAKLFEEQIPF